MPADPPLATASAWDEANDGDPGSSPLFEHHARAAVALAGLSREAHELTVSKPSVLDVGCGSGTATLLAAPFASRVAAVDFSPAMIAALRRRLSETSLAHVTPHLADCRSLPFEDASFDVALALFSVIFVPDRAQAFSEIHRVLRPAGRLVVASWAPMADVPALAALFAAMNEEIPGLVGGPVTQPLSTPALCHAELAAAGFRDVAIHPSPHRGRADSPSSLWWQNALCSPLIQLLRKEMGSPDFEAFSDAVIARLASKLGPGPVVWGSLAYLSTARR